jgi:hypothetical protein
MPPRRLTTEELLDSIDGRLVRIGGDLQDLGADLRALTAMLAENLAAIGEILRTCNNPHEHHDNHGGSTR